MQKSSKLDGDDSVLIRTVKNKLTEEKKRQQSTASITVSRQSSTQPTTEELGPNSRHRTDLPDLIENHAGQTAVYSSGESFFSISWM
jgi:hypothetical protein